MHKCAATVKITSLFALCGVLISGLMARQDHTCRIVGGDVNIFDVLGLVTFNVINIMMVVVTIDIIVITIMCHHCYYYCCFWCGDFRCLRSQWYGTTRQHCIQFAK